MSAVTLLGILFAPQLVGLMTWWSWSPEKTALTILLTRIMWPFILLVSVAALVMGMLNARNVFGMPAMASSFFNLGSIMAGVALGWWFDPHFGARSLIGLSLGILVGGLWQLTAQFPSLRRVGYRYRADFDWRDHGVRTVLGLMGPAVIAAGAVQMNALINSGFAARLGDGPVSWLSIAFRLMQFPLGIFGVAVATVTLPLISRSAAVNDTAAFRGALSHAIRLVLLLTIPAAIGLIILANPISVIYEHGRFDAFATEQTALALRCYAIGLVAYSADKVLAPAFYALHKPHLPMFVSLCSIAINFGLNFLFAFRFQLGHRGVALSTSLVAFSNVVMLYTMMRRHTGSLETGTMLKTLTKLAVAGALLAAICLLAQRLIFLSWGGLGDWRQLFGLALTIVVGGSTFLGAAYLLHVAELRDLVLLVRGHLNRLR
jgi:putative peptidoglycan lipid II flippase